MNTSKPVIELCDVSKSFGNTQVIEKMNLKLYAGEVHALMGENGAGKSTMVKMLSGFHRPDSGHLLMNGKEVVFHNTAQAKQAGIAVIYQEPTLFADLSIAENIYMGQQPINKFGVINYKRMNIKVQSILAELGVSLSAKSKVLGLSIADQQVVEIAKALISGAKVLIMDEPTAALSLSEVNRLFKIVNKLKQDGAAILFISHRLEEVFEISQRATIMRDGIEIDSDIIENYSVDTMVKKMVGRSLTSLYPQSHSHQGEIVLDVKNLSSKNDFHDISFTLKKGEVLGIAGLVGSGRTALARAIFGINEIEKGSITIHGQQVNKLTPAQAMQLGIALVPEDRREQGLIMTMSAMKNTTLPSIKKLTSNGLLSRKKETSLAKNWTDKMQLNGNLDEPVDILSGGNQQKIVLAKWLSTNPSLLMIDEPTRGVDIGAKSQIHQAISDLTERGLAVLMVSSELPEILGMSDRVIVMHEGRITAEFNADEANEEAIMFAATGQQAEQHVNS